MLTVAATTRSFDDLTAIAFIDIAIIVAVARAVGVLFRKIRQPAVVGEIVAGIALGPSLLGLLPGQLPSRVFPTDVRPYLSILAQLGLIIFMFIVGLEVDVALIRGKERIAGVISLSSIALPFGLGVLLAGALHASHTNSQAPHAHRFVPFALFIGASMSITAFPVLARILTERHMFRTEIGALALACAAVDDVVAWTLLALVLAIIKSKGALSLPLIILESLAFVAFMFLVVKPALARVAQRYRERGELTPTIFAIILVGFLVSSFITERIGIHQIFGAFLFGVVMPRKDTAKFLHDIVERLEQVSVHLLLPLFFIVTGFSVDLRHLGRDAFTQLPLIMLVAISGKLIGAAVAARIQGLPAHKATALGVLMNTRGLTELIILNVGREFGVLDTRLFTMLVTMAILTTIMTEPLLRLAYPDRLLDRDIAAAATEALGAEEAYRVLAFVGGESDGEELVDTAADLIGEEETSELVLTSFTLAPPGLEMGTGLAQELGEMASVLERLQSVARHSEQRVRSVVRAQFSDDIGRDLVAQVAAVNANVVLLASPTDNGDALFGRLLQDAPAELVLVVHPEELRVVAPLVAVVISEGPNGVAALALAAKVAFSRHCSLRLIPEDSSRKLVREAADRAESMTRTGLASQAHPRGDESLEKALADSEPSVVVMAVDDRGTARGRMVARAAQAVVLLVRASADDDGQGLERWLRERFASGGEGGI